MKSLVLNSLIAIATVAVFYFGVVLLVYVFPIPCDFSKDQSDPARYSCKR